MKPQDTELLHARGRLSYSVAHLGWFERTVVATFYKRAPPVLTYDNAISDFLQVSCVFVLKPTLRTSGRKEHSRAVD